MGEPRTYHFKLPRYEGPLLAEPSHAWYPGIDAHVAASTSDRLLHSDGQVRAFVIHATAGSGSAGAMSGMFEHRVSWHWLVPDENEPEHGVRVWACAPERRAAWHVRNDRFHADVNGGRRYVNYWSLCLEIVNVQDHQDAFSSWQVEQAAALVRYAWSKYPALVDVISHAKLDPQRRHDPGTRFPWDRFRELVLGPVPSDVRAAPALVSPIHIVGPSGNRIACEARPLDGVTFVEARPLIEALGFEVDYEEGPPRTLRIRETESGSRRPKRGRRAKVQRGAVASRPRRKRR